MTSASRSKASSSQHSTLSSSTYVLSVPSSAMFQETWKGSVGQDEPLIDS